MQDILKREADRFHSTHVQKGLAFGELDHPDPNSPLFRKLDGRNISHQVRSCPWPPARAAWPAGAPLKRGHYVPMRCAGHSWLAGAAQQSASL
jgi:hypothetical protein